MGRGTLRTDNSRFGTTLEFDKKVEVETTTLEELIRSYGRPFYIKIDVEGHEASVLKGLQSVVPFVSFEVNLPLIQAGSIAMHRITCKNWRPVGDFNYAPDCLRGLFFEPWLPRATFVEALNQCEESCVEALPARAPVCS